MPPPRLVFVCGDALKRDGPLDSFMGLEMVGLLVHKPTLNHLLNYSLSWGELKSGMEQATLRDHPSRPRQGPQNSFAIDAEADLLDWMDEQTANGESHASDRSRPPRRR